MQHRTALRLDRSNIPADIPAMDRERIGPPVPPENVWVTKGCCIPALMMAGASWLMIGFVVAALAGCAETPRARLAQARTTLSAAEETMIGLNDAGVMDDRAMLEADAFVRTARLAIDGAADHANGGSSADFEQYLSLAEAAIKRLMAIGGDNPFPDEAER